jgi:hypothetical protein
MFVDTPITRQQPEIAQDEVRGPKRVSFVTSDEDTGVAEAYDITQAVAGGVTHEADVLFDAPTSGVVAEIGDGEGGGGSDAVAEDGDAVEAEANDVACTYAAGGDWSTGRRRLVGSEREREGGRRRKYLGALG